jgi:hypothetical protein
MAGVGPLTPIAKVAATLSILTNCSAHSLNRKRYCYDPSRLPLGHFYIQNAPQFGSTDDDAFVISRSVNIEPESSEGRFPPGSPSPFFRVAVLSNNGPGERATIAAISATTMAMPPVNAALTAAIRELVLLARLDVSRALADVTGLREPSTARVALLFRLCYQSTHV